MSRAAHSRPGPRTANVLRLLEGKSTCLSKKNPVEAWLLVGSSLNPVYMILKLKQKVFDDVHMRVK